MKHESIAGRDLRKNLRKKNTILINYGASTHRMCAKMNHLRHAGSSLPYREKFGYLFSVLKARGKMANSGGK